MMGCTLHHICLYKATSFVGCSLHTDTVHVKLRFQHQFVSNFTRQVYKTGQQCCLSKCFFPITILYSW